MATLTLDFSGLMLFTPQAAAAPTETHVYLPKVSGHAHFPMLRFTADSGRRIAHNFARQPYLEFGTAAPVDLPDGTLLSDIRGATVSGRGVNVALATAHQHPTLTGHLLLRGGKFSVPRNAVGDWALEGTTTPQFHFPHRVTWSTVVNTPPVVESVKQGGEPVRFTLAPGADGNYSLEVFHATAFEAPREDDPDAKPPQLPDDLAMKLAQMHFSAYFALLGDTPKGRLTFVGAQKSLFTIYNSSCPSAAAPFG